MHAGRGLFLPTLDQLNSAKQEQDSRVVTWGSVVRHKTMKVHGPASVVLSEVLHKWLVSYVRYTRIHVLGATNGKDELVFMSWSGNEMTFSMVSAHILTPFGRSQRLNKVKVDAAAFRKAAVSVVHERHAHL